MASTHVQKYKSYMELASKIFWVKEKKKTFNTPRGVWYTHLNYHRSFDQLLKPEKMLEAFAGSWSADPGIPSCGGLHHEKFTAQAQKTETPVRSSWNKMPFLGSRMQLGSQREFGAWGLTGETLKDSVWEDWGNLRED